MKWIRQIFKNNATLGYYLGGILCINLIILWFFEGARSSGHIVFGDIDFGFFLEGYIERIATTWNSQWSNPNFFNLTRIPIIMPLYSVGILLGVGASTFLKGFIFFLLFNSGFWMFFLVTKLLRDDQRKEIYQLHGGIIFFIALLSGIFYALNPWSIVRIQHIYLLVGYAFLPLIFYLLLLVTELDLPNKKIKSTKNLVKATLLPSWRVMTAIFLIAIFWLISVGAVHYLFFTAFLIGLWGLHKFIAFAALGRFRQLRGMVFRYAWIGVLFIGMLSYFLLPQIGASLIQNLAPNNINTIDSVHGLARNSQFINVLYLMSYWWPMFDLSELRWPYYLGGGVLWSMIFLVSLYHLNNRFVRFFMCWTIAFMFLAMGTSGPLAPLIVWLVFDAPLSGTIGFLFRDANKFVGLMAFGYAILLGLNTGVMLEYLFTLFRRKQKELIAIQAFFTEDRKGRNFYLIPLLIIPPLLVLSFYAYITPINQHFFKQFYNTSTPPDYYLETNKWAEKNTKDQKVLWLPRNEMVVSPEEDFATAVWNEGKATSSIDIFSTQAQTYNTTEGSTPYMSNLYEFISDGLRNNKTSILFDYLKTLNISHIIYHADIKGFEDINTASIATLRSQDQVETIGKIGANHFFQTDTPNDYLSLFPQAIISTRGLASLRTLGHTPGFNFSDYAVWFLGTQINQSDLLARVTEGDLLNFRFNNDLILSQLTEDEIIRPFNEIKYADGFTRWAKNRVTTPDWKWHLEHLEIKNWNWDFDANQGLIFTYAPSMIDLEPYENTFEKATPFLTTQDFQNTEEDFFLSEDEELLAVDFAPLSTHRNLPFVKGEISRGDSDYWKVTSSQFIDVEEKNGYIFAISLSGKDTNKIHGKVKYYDDQNQELTVSYVSAPRQVQTFNYTKFTGQFITPPGTKRIKLQLWTRQEPSSKLYWWIHDLEIKDLGNYMKPNVINLKKGIQKPGKYKVLARVFHNQAGGKINLSINGEEPHKIKTKTNKINQFFWEEVGTFDLPRGFTYFDIENISGFNALNLIAVVPEEKWKSYQESIKNVAQKTRTLYTFETEQDFLNQGNIQDESFRPNLSNGKAIYFEKGQSVAALDVIEEGTYQLLLGVDAKVYAKEGKNLYLHLYASGDRLLDERAVDTNIQNIKDGYLLAGRYDLIPGRYSFKLSFDDQSPSLLQTKNLHPFEFGAEWREKETYLDTLGAEERNKDCCDCVDLGEDFLNVTHPGEDEVQTKIREGCSCWWVITASEIREVLERDKYLLSFQARSNFARRNHFKMIFLDRHKVFLDYYTLQSSPQSDTYPWTYIEEIIDIPEHTQYVQFQIWSRENRFTKSEIGLKDLTFKRYYDLPMVDNFILLEEDPGASQSIKQYLNVELHEPTLTWEQSADKTAITGRLSQHQNHRWIVQIAESFTPLWQMSLNQGELSKPIPQLSIVNNFTLDPNSIKFIDLEIRFLPQRYFHYGLLMSLFTLLLGMCVVHYRHYPDGIKQINHQRRKIRHFWKHNIHAYVVGEKEWVWKKTWHTQWWKGKKVRNKNEKKMKK